MNAGQAKATEVHCSLLLASILAFMFFPADVNVSFQQSAHKVLLDDDNLLPLLHLTIEYHGKEHKGLPFFPVSLLLLVSLFPFLLLSPSMGTI
jgi:hypothetical protein